MLSSMPHVHILVEGLTDEIVIRRILQDAKLTCGFVRGLNGKEQLLEQLPKYNAAARRSNWLVVVDLDQDAECAPDYVREKLPHPSEGMLLRIAVRTIESWLLADRERFAAFLGIAVENIPDKPDNEENPKTTLLNLARRSKRKKLREDIAPRPGSGRKVGPGYLTRIIEFVTEGKYSWRPEVAAENSDSLRRCIEALRNWKMVGFE